MAMDLQQVADDCSDVISLANTTFGFKAFKDSRCSDSKENLLCIWAGTTVVHNILLPTHLLPAYYLALRQTQEGC